MNSVASLSGTRALIAALLAIVTIPSLQADILVPTNSVWRFFRGASEASTPPTDWRTNTFDDSSWEIGPAPFYFGFTRPSGTELTDMRSNYTCIFLRRTFVLTNGTVVVGLTNRPFADDGFITWLNGVELRRFNVPGVSGSFVAHETNAVNTNFVQSFLPANPASLTNVLRLGTNVLAVQVFNVRRDDLDFHADPELHAAVVDLNPPAVKSILPAPGSTVSALSQVTVTFTKPVAGVSAPDLMIADLPASFVTGSNATYTFSFSQPAHGLVSVTFDADTTITDLAGAPFDPFAAGSSWFYTLTDLIAPVVTMSEPASGAVVGALDQIEVTFNESVTGVDAGDLLVNGSPATGVTPIENSQFSIFNFQFPQPPSGAVTISWTAGHGIQDLSPAANSFGGTGWSYTLNPAAASGDVVINEFLAENQNSIEDSDGQQEDWIELRNRGANAVNLTGWSLTDDPAQPGKWVFPNITLNAGQYLIVFASGKDRKTTAASTTNHTNFRLNVAGGYLALFNSSFPRVAVSEFMAYPEQRADISYGLTASGMASYFSTLTPRAANNDASAASGFVQPPHASVKSGLFNQPFNLVLSTETSGAEIRYTLDGSVPTTSSALYTGPITVAGTPTKAVVTVRARGFKQGQVPSSVTTRTYIFPDHVLTQPANPAGFPSIWDSPCTGFNNCNDINPADYEMDPQVLTNTVDNYRALARQGLVSIPTVSIVTDVNLLFGAAQGVYVRREPFLRKPINAEYILPDGSEGFQIDCGLEMQGQTSPDDSSTGGSKWKSLKLGLRLFFQGEFGPTKLRYKVFEDSPVEEFDTLMLAGGHNNYWNYNNNDTQRTRSTYVRDQYVANLQNALGGLGHHGRFVHLYLNGLYWGLYQLHERPDESFQASYQGGDKEEYNVFKHDSGQVVAGSSASYSAMWTLINAGLANNANYELLQQRLDVPDLINYLLVNYWANNTDWAHKNLYASQRTGGKWRFHAWDSEHVIAATDFDVLSDNEGTNPTAIFNRLLNNAEFRILLADQIHKHFFNGGLFFTDIANPIYNPAFPERNRPAHTFMKMLQEIDTAIVCESARWGDVGPGRENTPHMRNTSFYEERDILMGYRTSFGSHSPVFFPGRSTNLLNQFRTRGWYPTVVAPSFNQHGGRVPAGFNLTMTVPTGAIYYTTNGADPRVYGSGGVSPSASTYTGSFTLNETTVVKARTRVGTTWSALNEATFVFEQLTSPLRITEIMFNPVGGDTFEFIELQNVGGTPLSLGGLTFGGISFTFPPGTTLAPGAIFVLANNANAAAFATRYPGVAVGGYFGGVLANGGERITLTDGSGKTVLSVDYDDEDGWPAAADGGGYSLEIAEVNGDPDDPANWRASNNQNGTPGQPNSTPSASSVVLNELMAENVAAVNNSGTYPDWIELHNSGGTATNIAGWSVSDDGNARKFVFPPGTVIPAGGYLVVWCDSSTNSTPGLHTGFALDREGDSVFLYDASVRRVDAISFGTQAADYSIGRILNSQLSTLNSEWMLNAPTPNAANVAAMLASPAELSINEWLANPVPGSEDWIELFNASTTLPASLHNLYLGTSNALFQLRALSFLGPRRHLQLFADEQPGVDHLDLKLPASAGAIVLYDSTGAELQRVTYGAQAEGVSRGRLPDGSTTLVAFPGSMSPGAANYTLNYTGAVLNEVLARRRAGDSVALPGSVDFVELFNPNASAWHLGGMGLSDEANEIKFIFAPGTTISANGYLVVWCDGSRAAVTNGTLNTGFSLSGNSGGVYLFNPAGQVVNSVEYGSQVEDRPIGVSAGQWNLLNAATPGGGNAAVATFGSTANLRINEWMANPLRGDDWFELHNLDPLPVNLSGLYLTDDPSLAGLSNTPVAALSFVAGGGWVDWTADARRGAGRDHTGFQLDEEGETIRLYALDFAILDDISFGAQAAGVSEGRFLDGSATIVSFPQTASPGAPNYLLLSDVVINEALTHSDPPLEDAIELRNLTAAPVNISGWWLSDSTSHLRKFRIPDSTVLPPNGFAVFYENQFNADTNDPSSFALSSAGGDEIHLSASDSNGALTGYRRGVKFGAAENGVSFGRYVTSDGREEFVAMSARTFGVDNPVDVVQFRTGTGRTNAYPKVGPIVISQIMHHPQATDAGDNTLDEFIELRNASNTEVNLHDAANTWRLRDAVDFNFPPGVSLPAGGSLLLVSFDPIGEAAQLTSFRVKYGVPVSIPVLGPYSGKLDNSGENVELQKPDPPGSAEVPYVLAERVEYSNAAPWPASASGTGLSLQRVSLTGFGNDPTNWVAALPDFGGSGDTDGDGMPDTWETQHGLLPNDPLDANADADGDKLTNLQEFLSGTSPIDANDVLRVLSIQSSGANVVLTFPAAANKTYVIEFNETLGALWSGLTNVPAAPSNRVLQVVSPRGASTRFFRIRTP